MSRLTDRRAVELALRLAIDYETDHIDAYGGDESTEAVQDSMKNIAAFRRVLERYCKGSKPRSIRELFYDSMEDAPTVGLSELAKRDDRGGAKST